MGITGLRFCAGLKCRVTRVPAVGGCSATTGLGGQIDLPQQTTTEIKGAP
jgi:hypothetical protein